jgi:SAM-dependent methyltransferase
MRILDHFGLLAPCYDRCMHAPSAEIWCRALGLPAPALLLDVAGGTGRVAGALAGWVTAVVVIDASLPMLQQAAARPGVLAAQSAAEHLPFADGSFSHIIMVDALHHVAHTRRCVEEMLRVLAPGGRLVIEEPDWRRFGMRLVAIAERLTLMRSHPEQPGDIVAFARQAGMRARCMSPQRNTTWIIIDKPERTVS